MSALLPCIQAPRNHEPPISSSITYFGSETEVYGKPAPEEKPEGRERRSDLRGHRSGSATLNARLTPDFPPGKCTCRGRAEQYEHQNMSFELATFLLDTHLSLEHQADTNEGFFLATTIRVNRRRRHRYLTQPLTCTLAIPIPNNRPRSSLNHLLRHVGGRQRESPSRHNWRSKQAPTY